MKFNYKMLTAALTLSMSMPVLATHNPSHLGFDSTELAYMGCAAGSSANLEFTGSTIPRLGAGVKTWNLAENWWNLPAGPEATAIRDLFTPYAYLRYHNGLPSALVVNVRISRNSGSNIDLRGL